MRSFFLHQHWQNKNNKIPAYSFDCYAAVFFRAMTVRSTYRAAILPELGWRCGVYHRGYRGRGQAMPTNWTVYIASVVYCLPLLPWRRLQHISWNCRQEFYHSYSASVGVKKNERTCYAYLISYPTKNLNIPINVDLLLSAACGRHLGCPLSWSLMAGDSQFLIVTLFFYTPLKKQA